MCVNLSGRHPEETQHLSVGFSGAPGGSCFKVLDLGPPTKWWHSLPTPPRAPSVAPTEGSYTPSLLPPPTGLSDKELARMRAESLVPRPTSAYMGSSGFHFDDVPVATINSEKVATIPPSDNQGL
jgi:hypothetical protein